MVFIKKRIFIFLYLLVVVLFVPLISEGADISFRLEPTKVRVVIPAGDSKSGTIKAYNYSGNNVEIKVYLEDWVYSDIQDGTKNFFLANSTPFSCTNWISFSPSEIVIPAYSVQNINYVIRVPKDAKGAGYAVMFFETTYLKAEEQQTKEVADVLRAGTSLSIRIGTLFYVDVKDIVIRNAQLSNLSVTRDAKTKYLAISSDFKNIANADITAVGTFIIMDKNGMVYARGEFKDVYAFPGDTAKLTTTWKESIPPGKYSLVITLDLGKPLKEAGLGRGPVIVKEAEIEIGVGGEVVRVGELK